MFGGAAPTPFDLHFQIRGIPVRIHPFFWLMGALGGWDADFPHLTVLWIACLFVSILVHELGHALMAQRFGWPIVEVCLYHFGGYCQYDPWRGYTSPRAIQVALAGPGAGFVLFGIVMVALIAADRAGHPEETLPINLQFVILQLVWINLWWGLVNLVPCLPLDGGHVLQHLLRIWMPRSADNWALKISIVAGGLAALGLYQLGSQFGAMLFGILTIQNVMSLQNRSLY